MSDRPKLDPALQRHATEALAHTGEARRLIAELAKSRGITVPPPPSGFEDIAEEVSEITERLDALAIAERERATQSGRAPQLSLTGPFGFVITGRGKTVVVVAVIAMILATVVALAWLARGRPTLPAAPNVVLVPAHS